MLQIYTNPIYKKIGQNIVPIITDSTPKAENIVPRVTETLTENTAGKFSNLRKRAEQVAQELNISYEKALKVLQDRGEKLIDILV